MRIDPAIAALRSDKSLQRRLRAAMDCGQTRWNETAAVAAVLGELDRYASGAQLSDLNHLAQLFVEHQSATEFVSSWCRDFAQLLCDNPLGQIPFRHHYAPGFASLQLASGDGAALSLAMYEELPQVTVPAGVSFSDRHICEIVLEGRAQAVIHRLAGARGNHAQIESEPIALAPGSRLELDGLTGARHIGQVQGQLLVLQLTRAPRHPKPSREYDLASGELLMQACGDKRASQLELAMAALAAMDRQDAASPMAALARHEGPEHLRWEAIRHALALDTATGFEALALLANARADPLSDHAVRLVQQLQASYPQLKAMEDVRCPA